MTQIEELEAADDSPAPVTAGRLPDESEIGRMTAERARVASEIGAAMAHELNAPMTALLLYVGEMQQNSGRFVDTDGAGESLKHVVENAFREAERICTLIHRMGDGFEAPLLEETAIAVGRDAIGWWSRAGDSEARARTDAGHPSADDTARPDARPLTPREREVLRLVSEGYSNKEGAAQLKISYRTFEGHRAEVMRKLGAKNAAELVRLVLTEPAAPCASPEPDSG